MVTGRGPPGPKNLAAPPGHRKVDGRPPVCARPSGGGSTLLRLATRFNWRVAGAILAIAVASLYSTGAFVLLDGLEAGSGSVLARIETGPFLAAQGTFPVWEAAPLPVEVEGAYAGGWLRPALLEAGDAVRTVRLLSVTEVALLGLDAGPTSGEVHVSPALLADLSLAVDSNVTVSVGNEVRDLRLTRLLRPGVALPDTWLLVAPDPPEAASLPHYDFLLVAERGDALRLAEAGYGIQPLASTADFFLVGLQEARRLLLGVVVAGGVATAAASYSLLALEIRYRRREMRTLRAVGLNGAGLVRLYGLQVAFVAGTGALLGIAAGIVAAHGLVSFAPFFGLPTLIRPHLTPWGLLLPLLSGLAAGLAGGFLSLAIHLRGDAHDAPG